MPITTADLFSYETVNRLVTEPLFQASVALATLTPLRTIATTVSIPTVALGTASFVTELTPLTDANVAAEMLPVTPKKVGAVQIVSRESATDAAAAPIIGRALVASLADTIDQAFFLGNAGAASPAGLPGFDYQEVDASPGSLDDLDAIAEAIAKVEEVGGTASALYCSPAGWQHLSTLKVGAESAQPLLHAPGALAGSTARSVYGLAVHVSRHVPDSEIWVIDSSRTLAVVRDPIELATSEHEHFSSDGIAVRATARVEFASPHENVVVLITGGES